MPIVVSFTMKTFILLTTILSVQQLQIARGQYLEHFQYFKELQLTFPGKSSVEDITSSEECAKICFQTKDFSCESFEFCEYTKSCIMYTQHVWNLIFSNNTEHDRNPLCDLYATNTYIQDFYNVSKKCVDDFSVTTHGPNLLFCGQTCFAMKDKCLSFNYIPPKTASEVSNCSFSVWAPSMKNYPPYNNPSCRNYESKFKIEPTPGPGGDTGGKKPGTVFAIVAGVLAVVLVLSIIGYFGYKHYRKNYGTSFQHSGI